MCVYLCALVCVCTIPLWTLCVRMCGVRTRVCETVFLVLGRVMHTVRLCSIWCILPVYLCVSLSHTHTKHIRARTYTQTYTNTYTPCLPHAWIHTRTHRDLSHKLSTWTWMNNVSVSRPADALWGRRGEHFIPVACRSVKLSPSRTPGLLRNKTSRMEGGSEGRQIMPCTPSSKREVRSGCWVETS